MNVLAFDKVEVGMIGEDYNGDEVEIISKGLAKDYGVGFVEELAEYDMDENTECVLCRSLDGDTAVYTYSEGGVDVIID